MLSSMFLQAVTLFTWTYNTMRAVEMFERSDIFNEMDINVSLGLVQNGMFLS